MTNVEEKWKAAWDRAGMLPAASQLSYRAQLKSLRTQARARAALPKVAGDEGEWEWDLALANQLDRIYGAVSDQAAIVYGKVKDEASKAVDATAEGAAKLGFGIWPIALAVVAVLYFYNGKGSKR